MTSLLGTPIAAISVRLRLTDKDHLELKGRMKIPESAGNSHGQGKKSEWETMGHSSSPTSS
jgi:hypothetical protein